MTPQETWRPVPEWEHYEVSDLGRIRRAATGRVLKPWLTLGYEYITLCHEGRQVKKRLHILVALAFHGPRPEGMTDVRHLDGNPRNNAATNLAYGTRSDNMLDIARYGQHYLAARTHCKNGHEFTPENTDIRIQRNGRPSRQCRACHHAASREQARKLREAKRSA